MCKINKCDIKCILGGFRFSVLWVIFVFLVCKFVCEESKWKRNGSNCIVVLLNIFGFVEFRIDYIVLFLRMRFFIFDYYWFFGVLCFCKILYRESRKYCRWIVVCDIEIVYDEGICKGWREWNRLEVCGEGDEIRWWSYS